MTPRELTMVNGNRFPFPPEIKACRKRETILQTKPARVLSTKREPKGPPRSLSSKAESLRFRVIPSATRPAGYPPLPGFAPRRLDRFAFFEDEEVAGMSTCRGQQSAPGQLLPVSWRPLPSPAVDCSTHPDNRNLLRPGLESMEKSPVWLKSATPGRRAGRNFRRRPATGPFYELICQHVV